MRAGLVADAREHLVEPRGLERQRQEVQRASLDRGDHPPGARRLVHRHQRQPDAAVGEIFERTAHTPRRVAIVDRNHPAPRRMVGQLIDIGVDLGMVTQRESGPGEIRPQTDVGFDEVYDLTFAHGYGMLPKPGKIIIG